MTEMVSERRRRLQDRFGDSILAGLMAAGIGVAIGIGVARLGDPFVLALLAVAALVPATAWVAHRRPTAVSVDTGSLETLDRIAVWSLSAALGCITWNAVRVTRGVALCDAFLFIAALAAVLSSLLHRENLLRVPRWILLPAYALALDALLVVTVHEEALSALLPAARLIVALSLTPLVIGQISGRLGSIRWYVGCWLFSVAVSALIGTADAFLHTGIGPSLTGVVASGRYAGLTAQPNHLAFSTVMALPVVFALLLTSKVTLHRVALALLAGLSLAAILASGSRGGLLAGLLAVIALPLLLPGRRAQLSVAVALGALLLVGVGQILTGSSLVAIQRLEDPTVSTSVAKSDNSRVEFAKDALQEFESSPLVGSGFTQIRAAHSLYLQLLSAGGIVALLAFLSYIGGAVKTGLDLVRRLDRSDAASIALAYGLILSVAIWLLLGTVENQIYDRYLVTPVGLILAFSLAQARQSRGAA